MLNKTYEWLADQVKEGAYTAPKYPTLKRYPSGYVFDENMSVKWNREEVETRNARHDELVREFNRDWYGVQERFREDLRLTIMAEHNFNPIQAQIITDRAWSAGHSCGYEEIIDYARDYGTMAKSIIAAGGYIDD